MWKPLCWAALKGIWLGQRVAPNLVGVQVHSVASFTCAPAVKMWKDISSKLFGRYEKGRRTTREAPGTHQVQFNLPNELNCVLKSSVTLALYWSSFIELLILHPRLQGSLCVRSGKEVATIRCTKLDTSVLYSFDMLSHRSASRWAINQYPPTHPSIRPNFEV